MYKVGDKVTIKSMEEVGCVFCEAQVVYVFPMNAYAGKNAIIKETHKYIPTGEYWYHLVSESGERIPYEWTDSMLKKITD